MYTVYRICGKHRHTVGHFDTWTDAKRAVSKYSTGAHSLLDGSAEFWMYVIREEK